MDGLPVRMKSGDFLLILNSVTGRYVVKYLKIAKYLLKSSSNLISEIMILIDTNRVLSQTPGFNTL